MKVMYVAFMFHTNQVPIMKGWQESERDAALFVSYTPGNTEDHTFCKPIVLGFSKWFHFFNSIYELLHRRTLRKSSFPEAFAGKYGFPAMGKVKKLLKQEKPDLVILRDRYLYTIFFYRICRKRGIPCILYNQNPFWEQKEKETDRMHKLVYRLTPTVRMTPVLGSEGKGITDPESYYVPFVMEKHLAPMERTYFKNGDVNILCVGKYEKRKNHKMLLEVLQSLLEKEDHIHLKIVGEVSTEYHKSYFEELQQYAMELGIASCVDLYKNCKPSEMGELYAETDVFVLPSTGEFASVSQLEAMSYSVPVIVSDTNGTACCVEDGVTGFLMKDNDSLSLLEKLEALVLNRKCIVNMGKESCRRVEEQYSFEKYRERIVDIYERIKG